MSDYAVALPSPEAIAKAREAIAPYVLRTPLVRLNHPSRRDIFLKLENLQPIGSFKIRCGANALLSRMKRPLKEVTTASAGNFAQGLALAGRDLSVRVNTIVPDTAAKSKLEALEALGARIVKVPYAEWWALMEDVARMHDDPAFIHPVADTAVLAGNATIGLEILEDCPEVGAVFVPFGGGGLSVGIAAAVHAKSRRIGVFGCESEAGTPLAAALASGAPTRIAFNSRTFITGMGSGEVLKPMWPLIRDEIAGARCASLKQVADAVRLLLTANHVLAEGAGAAPVAAALAEQESTGPLVCIVSGGHLDVKHLRAILDGNVPE